MSAACGQTTILESEVVPEVSTQKAPSPDDALLAPRPSASSEGQNGTGRAERERDGAALSLSPPTGMASIRSSRERTSDGKLATSATLVSTTSGFTTLRIRSISAALLVAGTSTNFAPASSVPSAHTTQRADFST